MNDTVIDLNWLMLLLGTVIPLLTGLVTARLAHPGVKAAVLALLAALSGIGNELYSAGGNWLAFDWSSSFANAVTTFLVAVGLHFGLLSPAGLTGRNGVVQRKVPAGVGGRHAAADDHIGRV